MNDEQQIIDGILKFAKDDENVKVALLNGSRANKNAPSDFMQDYDIALFVTDLNEAIKYKQDAKWMLDFGNVVMVQQNNFFDGSFIFLIQYDDGLRIDLSFMDVENLHAKIDEDSLSVLLYDPDKLIKYDLEPNESTYTMSMPPMQRWDEVLNELWWIQCYVAKELWRDELPLAKELYDIWLIKPLKELLSWHICIESDWQVNVGHGCKWFKRLLEPSVYDEFISLYSSADLAAQWDALFKSGAFIRKIGVPLAKKLGYVYPEQMDANVSAYIRNVSKLPSGAKSFII